VQYLRSALNDTKKLNLSVDEYFTKMKGFAAELAAAGKTLEDDEFMGYLLHGFDGTYNALVTSVEGNPATTIDDFLGQLCSYDARNTNSGDAGDGTFISSMNVARRDDRDTRPPGRSPDNGRQEYRGGGGDYRRHDGDWRDRRDGRDGDWRDRHDGRDGDWRDRRDRHDRHNDGGDRRNDGGDRRNGDGGDRRSGDHRQGRRKIHGRPPTPYVDVTCQICKIHGHSAADCWWRHDNDSDDDADHRDKIAHLASYGVDSNWYTDTCATDHITEHLQKLSTHDKYQGHDHVHTAEGNGMHISHIGHSILRTPHSSFYLNNILHVPNASKNLLSVHKVLFDQGPSNKKDSV
jgi:hypothetical protein